MFAVSLDLLVALGPGTMVRTGEDVWVAAGGYGRLPERIRFSPLSLAPPGQNARL